VELFCCYNVGASTEVNWPVINLLNYEPLTHKKYVCVIMFMCAGILCLSCNVLEKPRHTIVKTKFLSFSSIYLSDYLHCSIILVDKGRFYFIKIKVNFYELRNIILYLL
jgi:hypothetical protein